MLFNRMAQRLFLSYSIPVSAPFPDMAKIPRKLQVLDDLLDGPLRNINLRSQVPYARKRVFRYANQHMGMIGKESPAALCRAVALIVRIFSQLHTPLLYKALHAYAC